MIHNHLARIPTLLVILRFTIAPLLLWDALDTHISPWFLGGYVFAVLSDIFDGIIARHLGVSTAQLRQADSWADICLYLCIAGSVWLVYPDVVLHFQLPLLLAIAAQLSLFALNLIKFGRFPSYHTYDCQSLGHYPPGRNDRFIWFRKRKSALGGDRLLLAQQSGRNPDDANFTRVAL